MLLSDLPSDILILVLDNVLVSDLSALSRTSTLFYNLVSCTVLCCGGLTNSYRLIILDGRYTSVQIRVLPSAFQPLDKSGIPVLDCAMILLVTSPGHLLASSHALFLILGPESSSQRLQSTIHDWLLPLETLSIPMRLEL